MKAVIHIGTGKTGTTSIQNILALKRAELQKIGVLYPRTLGPVNHELAAVCAADFHPGFTKAKAPSVTNAEDLVAFRVQLAQKLQQEVAESGCDTLLLSNEHLFEKVRSAAALQRLVDLLPPLDEVKIVIYMRHQTDFAAAIFSELLRMGSAAKRGTFLNSQRSRDLLDYYGGLAVWADRFGDTAIVARAFDRSQLAGGDVVQDFTAICGIDASVLLSGDGVDAVRNSRKTLDAGSTSFLEQFNQAVQAALAGDPQYQDGQALREFRQVRHRLLIVNALEQCGQTGKSFTLNPQQIDDVTKAAEAGNKMLEARFGVTLPEPNKPSDEKATTRNDLFKYFAALWIKSGLDKP